MRGFNRTSSQLSLCLLLQSNHSRFNQSLLRHTMPFFQQWSTHHPLLLWTGKLQLRSNHYFNRNILRQSLFYIPNNRILNLRPNQQNLRSFHHRFQRCLHQLRLYLQHLPKSKRFLILHNRSTKCIYFYI